MSRRSRPTRRNQLLFVVGLLILTTGAFYASLVVVTRIDHIFFPDSEIRLGGLGNLPLIEKGEAGVVGGRRINVLVMGVDKRAREGNVPSRTDSMFVMTVDPGTHTARGLAIPRDLWIDLPTKSGNSTFKQRINAAYVIGEAQDYSGGGVGLVKRVVQDLVGIKIDYYVMIDFEGFEQVINLLGGIDVDVEEAVNDPFYSETELPGDYYPCIFKAGTHHMDGKDALCFSRTRFDSDDLERINRQQRVILAVIAKATNLNLLQTDPVALWKRYKDTIKTDVNDALIPGFAKMMAAVDQISLMSLAAATTPLTTADGAQVLVASKPGIRQLVDDFLSDNRLEAEAATVELRYANGQEDEAASVGDYLKNLGIPESALTSVKSLTSPDKTAIVDFTGKAYTAERLADWLGVSRTQVRVATPADQTLRGAQVDIVVLLGPDVTIEDELVP